MLRSLGKSWSVVRTSDFEEGRGKGAGEWTDGNVAVRIRWNNRTVALIYLFIYLFYFTRRPSSFEVG